MLTTITDTIRPIRFLRRSYQVKHLLKNSFRKKILMKIDKSKQDKITNLKVNVTRGSMQKVTMLVRGAKKRILPSIK